MTAEDLQQIRGTLREVISPVEVKLTSVEVRLASVEERIASVEDKLTQKIASVEDKLTQKIASVEDKLTQKIASVEDKLTQKIASVEDKLTQKQGRAVETIASEFSSINQKLDLMSVTLQGIDTRSSVHNKVLIERGKDYAQDRAAVIQLRADLDAVIARIAYLEKRIQ